jgi:tetratricopeptide (TPR) repeat protein
MIILNVPLLVGAVPDVRCPMSKSYLILSLATLAVAIIYVELRREVPSHSGKDAEGLAGVERQVEQLGEAFQRFERNQDTRLTALEGAAMAAPAGAPEAADPSSPEAGEEAPPSERAAAAKAFLAKLAQRKVTVEEIDGMWNYLSGSGLEDEALAAFKAYAELNPNDADAHYGLGVALTSKFLGGASSTLETAALSAQADQAFSKALEIDDDHFSARWSKAFSYTFWPDFLGKGPEAIKHFEILRERHAGDPQKPMMKEVFHSLGNQYRKAGNFEKAKEVYEEGLKYFPDSERIRKQYDAMQK